MLHRRSNLLRAVVPAATLALALTACGSDDSSDNDNGQGDKGGSSQQDGGSDSDDSGESSEDDGADGSGGPYKLGETADGSHEANDKGTVRVTAEKVETGKNSDLTDAGVKSSDVKGQYPVFVYFKYQVEKMDKPQTSPNFNVNARVLGKGDERAKKLLTIGADAIKGGCPEKDDAEVKKGSTVTECSTFLLPEGTDVDQVAWAEDIQNPLIWNAAS